MLENKKNILRLAKNINFNHAIINKDTHQAKRRKFSYLKQNNDIHLQKYD
jgi:hypothetical protein